MSGQFQLGAIQLPKGLNGAYDIRTRDELTERVIDGLSHLNFFVGPNNSGKSRLLRSLASTSVLKFRPRDFPASLQETSQYLKSSVQALITDQIIGIDPHYKQINDLPIYDFIEENAPFKDTIDSLIPQLKQVKESNLSVQSRGYFSPGINNEIAKKLRDIAATADQKLGGALSLLPRSYSFERLYIPVLRGLRPLGNSTGQDHYANRTLTDYFDNKFAGNIFTGMSLYEDLRKLLLGDRAQRNTAREFEQFLSEHIFDGTTVSLIPRDGKDVVWVKLGNEVEYPIYDLGDGIQSLIALIFPLFRGADKPTLVFIEEPELFLHPGMQRALMKALQKFKNYQYFIATHSNHLLDLTLEYEDISIFMLHKKLAGSEDEQAKFEIERASSHEHQLLNILGTRASSVFLSNCTIWVEGITDRRYLAHFLHLYKENLKKTHKPESADKLFMPRADIHFSFVEYSGSNITHWSFLDETEDAIEVESLCARLMLIADRDSSVTKDERHEKLAAKLGDRFVRLHCREIENILPPLVFEGVLKEFGENLESLKDLVQSKYEDKYLGRYLDKLLTTPVRKGGYGAKSGTLKDKVDFCDRAIRHLTEWDQLEEQAQELTKRIYKFIKDHNI